MCGKAPAQPSQMLHLGGVVEIEVLNTKVLKP